jgi:hypothetical protein
MITSLDHPMLTVRGQQPVDQKTQIGGTRHRMGCLALELLARDVQVDLVATECSALRPSSKVTRRMPSPST